MGANASRLSLLVVETEVKRRAYRHSTAVLFPFVDSFRKR